MIHSIDPFYITTQQYATHKHKNVTLNKLRTLRKGTNSWNKQQIVLTIHPL